MESLTTAEFNIQVAKYFDLISGDYRARLTQQVKDNLAAIAFRINGAVVTFDGELNESKAVLEKIYGDYIKEHNIEAVKYFSE